MGEGKTTYQWQTEGFSYNPPPQSRTRMNSTAPSDLLITPPYPPRAPVAQSRHCPFGPLRQISIFVTVVTSKGHGRVDCVTHDLLPVPEGPFSARTSRNTSAKNIVHSLLACCLSAAWLKEKRLRPTSPPCVLHAKASASLVKTSYSQVYKSSSLTGFSPADTHFRSCTRTDPRISIPPGREEPRRESLFEDPMQVWLYTLRYWESRDMMQV